MSLMSAVSIVDVSYVAVPATAALPPEPIKLTAMEALLLPFPVLQHVLFYEVAGLTPFDSVVRSLRSSLGATLASFAQLAGKLVYLKDTGDVAIACSASDRVKFVAAESDADVRRLAGDELHDLVTFQKLVPELDMSKLPTSVLAVQATRLEGGLAVGVTVHHGVTDGKSFWMFMEAWAAACPARRRPRHRASTVLGEEIARSVLRKYAPNLPEVSELDLLVEERKRFTRRTFTVDAQQLERLKQRITRDGEVHGTPLHQPPSSFVTVIAMAWTFFARCKTTAADDGDIFFFADVRERLDPPVDAGCFGTCLTGCLVRLPVHDVHGDGAMAAAASAIQEEILKLAEDPLAGWNFMSLAGKIPSDRVMNVSGSPRFRPYDVDFGWGKPRRTEPIRMNHDGQVALVRAADGHGVQVSVSLLQSAHMEAFKSQMHLLEGKIFSELKVQGHMSAVSIVDVSYVAVPATAALPPEPIKLTAMEALWPPFPVLQHVLFYEVAGLPPFDSVVRSLRSSLGATLASFAPLAGKLVYLEDTGDVAIACSASDGVNHVAVPAKAALPAEPMELTAMEALWLRIPLLQHVLFYERAGSWPPFDNVVDSLRSSLSATLATFAPLAGKLVHREDTGDVAIVCSASDAVKFVEAECDADFRSVASGDVPDDLRLLEQLAPELDTGELPTSVMAVQATRLVGGVAVGVTVHQGVADGRSFWMFVEAWAAACRGETPAATPCFDRSVIKLPDGEALTRSVLRKYTPNLPVVSPSAAAPSSGEESKRYSRRTFTVGAQQLERLKKRIVRDGEAHGAPLRRPPSSFVALVATVWTLLVRSKTSAADDDGAEAFLFFFADFRERLNPPVDARYFGTCLTGCLVALPARDLHGDCALAAAASAMQEEIRRMAEDPLALWDFFSLNSRAAYEKVAIVSGSPGFCPYDVADFGWGKLRWTVPVRMNHDGQMALVRAGDGGGVQVSVSLLQPKQMDAFESHFLDLLG
uniref:Uncharacterized protein n=1 Tax=Oryza punctata TaxID=4537 RepID=A0A0E0KVS7_ORYPU